METYHWIPLVARKVVKQGIQHEIWIHFQWSLCCIQWSFNWIPDMNGKRAWQWSMPSSLPCDYFELSFLSSPKGQCLYLLHNMQPQCLTEPSRNHNCEVRKTRIAHFFGKWASHLFRSDYKNAGMLYNVPINLTSTGWFTIEIPAPRSLFSLSLFQLYSVSSLLPPTGMQECLCRHWAITLAYSLG
jgi:hypothetical protein